MPKELGDTLPSAMPDVARSRPTPLSEGRFSLGARQPCRCCACSRSTLDQRRRSATQAAGARERFLLASLRRFPPGHLLAALVHAGCGPAITPRCDPPATLPGQRLRHQTTRGLSACGWLRPAHAPLPSIPWATDHGGTAPKPLRLAMPTPPLEHAAARQPVAPGARRCHWPGHWRGRAPSSALPQGGPALAIPRVNSRATRPWANASCAWGTCPAGSRGRTLATARSGRCLEETRGRRGGRHSHHRPLASSRCAYLWRLVACTSPRSAARRSGACPTTATPSRRGRGALTALRTGW